MVRHGRALWEAHPHVRTGGDLTLGERAADHLKAAFGSWLFLICTNSLIVAWCVLEWLHVLKFDPYPFIALNLVLSWMAANQGGALQIAANRGDRISAEVAKGTHENTASLLEMQRQQTQILVKLEKLEHVPDDVAGLAEAVRLAVKPKPAAARKPAGGGM